MNDTKNVVTSKTIIGLFVAVLGVFLMANTGEAMTDEEAANWTQRIDETWGTLVAIGGILFAGFGRFKAEKGLNILGQPPKPPRRRAGYVFAIGSVLAGMMVLGGCKNVAFIEASAMYHQTVGADYIQYVEADESLSQIERNSRIIAHETYGEAIERERGR